MLTGLLSPCPESVCLGLDDPPMDPVPPPRESNKEKKDIKAQNLRREKPRQIPLVLLSVTKPQDHQEEEKVAVEKEEDNDIEEIPPTENSNPTNSLPTDVNPDLMEILENINKMEKYWSGKALEDGRKGLPQSTLGAFENARHHAEKGCVSYLRVGAQTQINENLHKHFRSFLIKR